MNLTVHIAEHLAEPTFDFCEPIDEASQQQIEIERKSRDAWEYIKWLCEIYPRDAAAREVILSDRVWADLEMTKRRLVILLASMDCDGQRA